MIVSGNAIVATTSAIVIQAIDVSTTAPASRFSSITGSATAAEEEKSTTA